jgi:hypothetical protein
MGPSKSPGLPRSRSSRPSRKTIGAPELLQYDLAMRRVRLTVAGSEAVAVALVFGPAPSVMLTGAPVVLAAAPRLHEGHGIGSLLEVAADLFPGTENQPVAGISDETQVGRSALTNHVWDGRLFAIPGEPHPPPGRVGISDTARNGRRTAMTWAGFSS